MDDIDWIFFIFWMLLAISTGVLFALVIYASAISNI